MMETVSVIIPTYGPPSGLKAAIDSVVHQSFQNWELIVVDDNDEGSEARQLTQCLMGSYTDPRILYIKHPHNLNGAVARNTGFSIAKGDYISLLDSDDMYCSERLSKCVKAMRRAPDSVAGVYTGCEFRRGGKVYHEETDVHDGNYLKETLACTFRFHTGSNIFVRKKVVDELKGFDPLFLRHQDYEFLARLFLKYDLTSIPEILVIKNNDNINLPQVEKMITIKEQYLTKFKDVIGSLSKKDRDNIYHTQYVLVAEAALRTNKKKIAREYYRKASSVSPLSLRETARRAAFTILGIVK